MSQHQTDSIKTSYIQTMMTWATALLVIGLLAIIADHLVSDKQTQPPATQQESTQ